MVEEDTAYPDNLSWKELIIHNFIITQVQPELEYMEEMVDPQLKRTQIANAITPIGSTLIHQVSPSPPLNFLFERPDSPQKILLIISCRNCLTYLNQWKTWISSTMLTESCFIISNLKYWKISTLLKLNFANAWKNSMLSKIKPSIWTLHFEAK